ncbi:family 3 carbohydrate esterase [Cryphonectria parasitica EP155]|uniref:Family 3 carbohydrate esterase n=1 Tax=Cryphonectria parasitica (strain ATCC 38755 / EP155) TaxID=660469 RepID=A0A9P4Y2V4_CRYP1|nr:family 3 carbohydrate esterase [Cryphonectria parasitica EP155]KAF3765342.1 family 3 carbohydrate esterase [Cryphonectria parasitica EP155]
MFCKALVLAVSLGRAVVAQGGSLKISTPTMKMLPLGDSITEITCWRAKLWDLLADANVTSDIQFVGSMTDNPQNCTAVHTDWDHHHEGHSGYLAIDIANSDLTGWLAAAEPDVVMFMLGTNDVFQGHATTDIIAAYTKMVGEMRASNPNMKIIVDTVISSPYEQSGITALNNAIPAWAQGANTTASPIYIADIAAVFPAGNTDLRDGVHPNDAGDTVIANVLAPLLTWVIQSSTAS